MYDPQAIREALAREREKHTVRAQSIWNRSAQPLNDPMPGCGPMDLLRLKVEDLE